MKIAVFISGSGTNLQSLLDAEASGFFSSTIELVVSNKADAYGLERARKMGKKTFVEGEGDLMAALKLAGVDFIVLAGYLKILGTELLRAYKGRIINIHPSLLPNYGGKGMYGIHVHEAVFAAGDARSGATVHYVNETVDGGKILLQSSVDISRLKSPEAIQKTVIVLEHELLKTAVRFCEEGIL